MLFSFIEIVVENEVFSNVQFFQCIKSVIVDFILRGVSEVHIARTLKAVNVIETLLSGLDEVETF